MRSGEGSRRARLIAAIAAALALCLLGGAMVLMFSGNQAQRPAALEPVRSAPQATTTATPEPAEEDSGSLPVASDAFGGLTPGTETSASLNPGGLPSGGSPLALPAAPSAQLPSAQLPSAQLPSAQLLALPQFPAAPTIDWQAAVQPYIQSQINSAAANMTGSITGTAVALGDLIRYAGSADNGQAVLSQLEAAGPALQSALAALPPPPDLSGLSSAFAVAAAQPPLGVPTPPPNLPTPEQVVAALAVPAIGLPAFAVPPLPPPPTFTLPPP